MFWLVNVHNRYMTVELLQLETDYFSYLKVAEVTDNVAIFLLVTLVPESKNCRNEVGEAKEFSNDGISSGDNPEDGLAAQIVFCQEVHHSVWRKRRRRKHRAVDE